MLMSQEAVWRITLGVGELQGVLVSPRRAEFPTLVWRGGWTHTGSLGSTCLHSLLFHCLQVHDDHYKSFGTTWPLNDEPQLDDNKISSPKDSWKTIC